MIQTRRKSQIVIVDDHPIFCLGMSELINREPDLTGGGMSKYGGKGPADH